LIEDNTFKKASDINDKFKKREVIVKKNLFDSTSKIDLGLMNLAIAADIENNTFKKDSTIVDKFKSREVIVKKNKFDGKSTIDLGKMVVMMI
jgi:hypothetical protein